MFSLVNSIKRQSMVQHHAITVLIEGCGLAIPDQTILEFVPNFRHLRSGTLFSYIALHEI